MDADFQALSIRLPSWMAEQIDAMAVAEHRHRQGQILALLSEALAARGHRKPPTNPANAPVPPKGETPWK